MADWAANTTASSSEDVDSQKDPSKAIAEQTAKLAGRLKAIYRKSILPVEKRFRYDYFYESPFLTDVEFDAKPQVMLVGQYSVGKTSFIRYLLGRDFPGQRIGPEPTTDRFTGKI